VIRVDTSYARLVGCIEAICARMDGYDPSQPDLMSVVARHPRVRRVVPVLTSPGGPWGRPVALGDGTYELHVLAAERRGGSVATTDETYERLARRTLAHELGHVVYWENQQDILAAWDKDHLNHSEFEHIPDLFARVFLMPRALLEQKVMESAALHPGRAMARLTREFHTVLRTLLPWMQQTGVTRELPWILALFRYGYNPHKPAENAKWRLVPGGLLLPRGLSRATAFEAGGVTVYGDPGYPYTGIDTMRLCCAGWEDRRFWQDLYTMYEESRVRQAGMTDPPWQDLNRPDGPQGGVSPKRVSLQPRRLAAVASAGGLPVCPALLPGPVTPCTSPETWTNTAWRLGVDEPSLFGWSHRAGEEQYVLVTGRLTLRPRCGSTHHA